MIDVVIQGATTAEIENIERINENIDNIQVNAIDINPLDRKQLVDINPQRYDNIILLASSRENKSDQQIDSENIVTLLLLRNIFEEFNHENNRTKLITEVLESQNHSLIAQAGVKDMIVSNRLISMITTQISESRSIKDVYDDLFQEDGSEIYLKPLSLYIQEFPVKMTFADAIALAQSRSEICFGIKIKSLEEDPEQNNGVVLIPDKNRVFEFTSEDSLVVVAEDEL